MKAGRLDEASEHLERCREVTAAVGNTFGVGCALFRLGWLAGANGEHERAVSLLKQALELHWALRNRRVVALILEQVACLQVGSSEAWDRARLFAAAEAMFEQIPDYTPAPQIVDAHERGVRAARERLGDEAFHEAWRSGRSMSVEGAVRVALEGEGEAPGDNLIQSGLSARELQVLRLVASGLTNREIGLRLGLSYHTIDHHLRRIFGKVGVSSRTGLAMWSVKRGLVSSPV
jgi:DNA-binding CsgD family transcriptional regulator